MVARKTNSGSTPHRRQAPATTPEARELQMVAYAFDLAEQQLLDGTASAQVITHFLKYGSEQNKLEREKLRKDNLLSQARVDQISKQSENSELYTEVLQAMKIYTGESDPDVSEL